MRDETLKQLWQEQRFDTAPSFPDEKQVAATKQKIKTFDRAIFWRDWRESLVAIAVALYFGISFFTASSLMAKVGCVIIVLSCVFICWYPIRQKRRIPKVGADAPVAQALQCELQNVEVQIGLLRSVLWWYLLPLGVGVLMFNFGVERSLSENTKFFVFLTVLYAFIHWINQRAVEKQLLPLKDEIEGLLNFGEPIAQPGAKKKVSAVKAILVAILPIALFTGLVVIRTPHKELREPQFNDISAFSPQDVAHIDAWLQEQVALVDYPSLSVAIVRDGEIAYMRAFGFEDIKAGRKATPQTSYNVASVTKAFTASLAVMLHARGVVDLDQPVAKYLPQGVSISATPEIGATITLRQLASHTSGLPRGIPGAVQSIEGRYQLEPKRLYGHLANVKLEYAPGTGELYSNLGFGLLGHALELAAGKPFDQLLQDLVCNPLQLERTAIQVDDKFHTATGYSSSIPRMEEEHSYRERLASSGGLVASVENLAKFLAAQMKPGVFTAEMLEQLHSAPKLSNGSNARRALGWSTDSSGRAGRILEKNGGRNNCSAWIGFSPRHRVGVAVVTNCGEPSVDPIGLWLLERSLKSVVKEGGSRATE